MLEWLNRRARATSPTMASLLSTFTNAGVVRWPVRDSSTSALRVNEVLTSLGSNEERASSAAIRIELEPKSTPKLVLVAENNGCDWPVEEAPSRSFDPKQLHKHTQR